MSAPRYGALAIALHWLIAVALVGQIALAAWMGELPEGAERAGWFDLHRSIGLTIAALMALRLFWRLRHPAPPLPATVPRWQARAAFANHAALYVLVFLVALSGYLRTIFSGVPVVYFGIAMPQWGAPSSALEDFFSLMHFATITLLTLLVALHIAAALKHLVFDRDGVFGRMWPGARSESR